MNNTDKIHHSQIRTNFIREDKGWADSYITYHYEDGFSMDFLGYRIFMYAFIDFETNHRSVAKITFKELFKLCGKKSDSKRFRKSKTYSLIINCLQWFIDNKYITIISDKPLDKYYFDEMIRIKITDFFLPSVKMVNDVKTTKVIPKTGEPFISLTQSELETFENMSSGSVPRLMAVYAYIKSKCGFRFDDQKIDDYPICCWESQEKMAKHLKCTQTQLSSYIKQLCSVGLLKRTSLVRVGNGRPSYIYTYDQPDWKEELYFGVLKYNKIQKQFFLNLPESN